MACLDTAEGTQVGESTGAGGRARASWAPTPHLSFLSPDPRFLTYRWGSISTFTGSAKGLRRAVAWPHGPGKLRWGADAARYGGGGAPQGPCAHREGKRQGSRGGVRRHAGRAGSFKTVKTLVSDGFNSTFCTAVFYPCVFLLSFL